MTYAEIHAVVERLTYKQGWRFALTECDATRVELTLVPPPFASRTTAGKEVQLHFHDTAYRYRLVNETSVVLWAWTVTLNAEKHEAREWFQLDGAPALDPHYKEALHGG